jgi:N-carbamoylputrescine amidase
VLPFAIALLQLAEQGQPAPARRAEGLDAVRRAGDAGADLALFPELWQTGYPRDVNRPGAFDQIAAQAIGLDDPFLDAHRQTAVDAGLAVVATFVERTPAGPRNAAALIDRHGEIVLTYAKVHTCAFGAEADLVAGDGFGAVDLDTRSGPVRVGLMICFDREFPESARSLMLAGAEVVATPNCCWLDDERIGQFRTRAFENMMVMAMTNYARPTANGRSCVFDGIAYPPGGTGHRDHRLAEAGEDDELVLATVDLDLLREYRATEIWGDHHRRPSTYGSLTTPARRPPLRAVEGAA